MKVRSKRAAAVAVSIAVHLAVLAILVLSTPALRLPTVRLAPDISLELSPRPLLRQVRREAVAASAARAVATAASRPASAPAAATPALRKPVVAPSPLPSATAPSPPALASAPQPASSATAAASAQGTGRDWRVRPEGGDDRGAVRAAIGCGHADYLKLTTDEQAACDRKYASLRGADLPHYDAIPPAKRAYYDAVVAAYAKMHAGTPLPFTVAGPGTNFGTTERWAGPPGAHMPAFGCKIPLGIPKGWKPTKGGPPHSLKLGPLPCYITPPSGLLTEEADLPDPTTLRPEALNQAATDACRERSHGASACSASQMRQLCQLIVRHVLCSRPK